MGGLRGTVGALRAKWSCLRIAVLWYWLFGGKTAYVTGTWKPRDRVLVATHRTAGCPWPPLCVCEEEGMMDVCCGVRISRSSVRSAVVVFRSSAAWAARRGKRVERKRVDPVHCMGPSEVSLAGHGLALRDVSGAIRLWPTGG